MIVSSTQQRPLSRTLAMILALSLASSVASADPTAEQRARATALFEQGQDAMKAGDYDAAIARLEESLRLEPADGTEINLALAYEKKGRFASALTTFKEALEHALRAKREDREKAAREHIASLSPKVSYLTINVPASSNVGGLVVTLDGEAVGAGSFGVAFPIDPGSHKVDVKADGKKPTSISVSIGASPEKKSIDVPALEDAPASNTSSIPSTTSATTTPPTIPEHPAPPSPSHAPAIVAFVAGGIFLAGGVGSFFLAKSAQSDRKSFCDAQFGTLTCPDDPSGSRMTRWQTISYASLGAAVVAAGIGVVLWTSSAGSESKSAVTVSPTVGGLLCGASF